MKVILKETIDTLGEEGDIVKVKPGYARNFLVPQQKAAIANKANLARLEQERTSITARKERQQQETDSLAKKITGTTLVIEHRAGEEQKLFGSVTAGDIAQKMAELGIEIDKKKILLAEPIKTLGETIVPVKIGYQANAEIKVQVVPPAE